MSSFQDAAVLSSTVIPMYKGFYTGTEIQKQACAMNSHFCQLLNDIFFVFLLKTLIMDTVYRIAPALIGTQNLCFGSKIRESVSLYTQVSLHKKWSERC